MSNPTNPLANFQTYSYHHILAVCDSTETAERLALPTADLTLFNRTDDGIRFGAQNVLTGESTTSQTEGNYVTLINGFSDAQLVITKASWTSLLAPQQSQDEPGGSSLSSMEFDGVMEIIEPRGARFMKIVADATKSLNRDPVGLTWVLRTVFVGQLPNGQTETITNVKGVTFMVTDIEAQFDEAGARYKMEFIGAVNGVGHMPAVQQIARGQSLPVTKGQSVGEALENYAACLNDAWKTQKELLQHQVNVRNFAVSSTEDPIDVNFDRDFARVEYHIKPDSDFFKFQVGTNEQVATQNTGDGDAVITPGEIVTVDSMIKRILDSSEDIQKLVKGEHAKNWESIDGDVNADAKPKQYMYKILSGLTSTPDLYSITYFVKLFEVPTTPFQDIFGGDVDPTPGQFIEFDYIFTGKNTDILEFDMTMQMGLAFLQVVAATNNTPSQTEYINQAQVNGTLATNAIQRASTDPKRKTKTPLFLGMKLSDPIFRHKKAPVETINFQTLFGRWAGLENVEAKIQITGNSQLLSDTVALPSDLAAGSTSGLRDVSASGQPAPRQETTGQVSSKQQEIKSSESTVAPAWTTRPVFMKINVKFPESNSAEGFNESFWWDGFYYLYSISHTFEDGQFTQDLEMFSIIQDDGLFEQTDESPELKFARRFGDADDGGDLDQSPVTQAELDAENDRIAAISGQGGDPAVRSADDIQRSIDLAVTGPLGGSGSGSDLGAFNPGDTRRAAEERLARYERPRNRRRKGRRASEAMAEKLPNDTVTKSRLGNRAGGTRFEGEITNSQGEVVATGGAEGEDFS